MGSKMPFLWRGKGLGNWAACPLYAALDFGRDCNFARVIIKDVGEFGGQMSLSFKDAIVSV